LNISQYEEENLHKQFLDFGIDNAISNLIRIEKEAKIYITVSIGGVLAWKAAMAGLPIKQLIAVSPTRLREESENPDCDFQLYFGKEDPNKPDLIWLEAFAKNRYKLLDGDHHIYNDKDIVTQILSSFTPSK